MKQAFILKLGLIGLALDARVLTPQICVEFALIQIMLVEFCVLLSIVFL